MSIEPNLRDVLLRNGFVECDIAACNCGSWHARFGWPERFAEIKWALEEADIDLNGKTVLSAVNDLIARATAATPAAREAETVLLTAIAMWAYARDVPVGLRRLCAEAGALAASQTQPQAKGEA